MKNLNFLIPIFLLCAHTSVLAKDNAQAGNAKNSNAQYAKAKHNFETECVRGLAEPVLLKNKVQNHHFQIKNTTDEFPILYGLETAQLGNGQSIHLENVGCESYGFDIQLILNTNNIENDQKFCQSCLIQELKRLAVYFKQNDRGFYLYGIQALEQQYAKYKNFKISEQYQLKGSEDMPQTFSFSQVKKQANGQYLVRFLNSVGPL